MTAVFEKLPVLADDLAEYAYLSPEKKARLLGWIRANFAPADQPLKEDSYKLKHEFEYSPGGCYVCNGQFKGAMIAAGFTLPHDEKRRANWHFFARRVVG